MPILAFASGLLTRFRHRGFFALITVIGLIIGVGAHPWTSPSPAGAAFKAFTGSDAGLAFRSTPRSVPLIALGLAVLLGAGSAAVSRRWPRWHLPVAGVLLTILMVNLAGLFRGQMVDDNLLRGSDVPGYWKAAAAALSAGDPRYRVYELPGTDFASYRWGNTVDPVTPGLTDRDYAARELIPYGTPASANLINDWDLPLQQGTSDPATFAPIARLLGVNRIVQRADLQYERFRTPRPRLTFAELLAADGLGPPQRFGAPTPNTANPNLPLQDEVEYGTPNRAVDPSPVSIFPVEGPRPMLRTEQTAAPIVMSGNGAGIVALASSGGLQADRPLLYTGSFADDPSGLSRALSEPDASLVVTDTNRRQARRWGSVRENDGYTEQAGETPLVRDPADNRLDVFPGTGDGSFTVSEQVGGAVAQASAYGNPVSYTPSDRAVGAVDGDPATAWRVGAFEAVDGQYLELRLRTPVTTDRLTLLQSLRQGNRWMTGVELTFGSGSGVDPTDAVPVALTDASRRAPGQQITFPTRTFDRLRITITRTNREGLARYTGISDVGIAEVTVPGVEPTTEIIRPPVDLLARAGPSSISSPLTYLFNRRSANPAEVVVQDEEPSMLRWVEGPVTRTFTPFGKARVDARIPDDTVDRLIGMPSVEQGALTATSAARLAGDLRSRAASGVDGDPATAWQTPVNGAVGDWIQVQYPQPVSFDRLPVTVVADGRHSVPTRISLQVDGVDGPTLDLAVPAVGRGRRRGATTTVDVPTGEITGTTFRFRIDQVREVASKDWFGGARTVLPAAIAELGLPVTRAQLPADTPFPSTCRTDLATVGTTPVGLQAVGTVDQALSRGLLRLASCAAPVPVPAGRTLLRTTPGADSGLDVDLLSLASGPGGGPGIDTLADPPGPGPTPPPTRTDRTGRLTYRARVAGADQPYWVVLGQSLSPGWSATANGVDLGPPTLLNGYANGWRVDPATVGRNATITLDWTPQRMVWIALWASLVGVLISLGLVIAPTRRRSGTRPARAAVPVTAVPVTAVRGVGPLSADGPTVPAVQAAAVALAAGGATALAMGPWVGLSAAAVTAAALAVRRGQVLLRVVCVGALGLAALYIVAKQARNQFVVDFDWMNRFEVTHAWALLATALLAVDPLVEVLRRHRRPG